MPVEVRTVQQAYRFALDPTPRQARMLASHAGAARFAFNWGIARTIEALDARDAEKAAGGKPETKVPGHFELCKQWTAWKDGHADDPEPPEGERRTNTAWVSENFVGTYQAALRDAAKAWQDYFKSRTGKRAGRLLGRPRFKKRGKSRDSFQVHGDGLKVIKQRIVRQRTVPRSETYLTPAVLRSRKRIWVASPTAVLGTVRRVGGDEVRFDSAGVTTTMRGIDGKRGMDGKRVKVIKPYGEAAEYDHVTLPKIGPVRLQESARKLRRRVDKGTARIVRGTVARESDGRWYIAITAEVQREVRTGPSARQRKGGTVGADFGVRELATLSDGTVIPNPRHLESDLGRLARAQRAVSRCEPGSRRRAKAVRRAGRLHARVKAERLDSLHKATSVLVHGYERIVVEGFDVQETARYRRGGKRDPKKHQDVPGKVRTDRNRALADAGIGIARWQIQSKAAWYGCQVTVTDKHAPTGRTCSACGTAKAKPVPPAEEMFTCEACGNQMPRRLNTARVLQKAAVAPSTGETQNAPGGAVSPGTARGTGQAPVKGDASTRPRPG